MAIPLKITFLGTGTSQGVPVIACDCEVCTSTNSKDKRLRSSILVETAHTRVVIDTGPDFRQQMLREQVKNLDAVLFTHEHKDHVAGLDDVRAFNFAQKTDMPLYCTPQVETALRREFHYAFAEKKYPGVPNLELKTIGLEPFQIGDVHIIPIQVMHHRLPVLGFRIGDFCYVTDANYIAPEELQKMEGAKTIALNALRLEPHVSHFNLAEAVSLIRHLAPEEAWFTHISHYLGRHEEVSQSLPKGMQLAYDGLVLEFD